MFARSYSKSAMRPVAILLLLSEVEQPLRAADIADMLQIARSSADQLLKSMVESGYLILSPYDKTYSPSPALAAFGGKISTRYAEYLRLQSAVSHLHDTLDEIVTLSVQNDCYMQILDIAGQRTDPTLVSGKLVPVIGTAAGAAAICADPMKQVRKLLSRSRYHAVPTPAEESKAFLESLTYFRQVGYSSWPTRRPVAGWESQDKDYWTVAVSVPTGARDTRVVLSTTGRAVDYRQSEKALADILTATIAKQLAPAEASAA